MTPQAAKQLWEDVEKAADYSFPKAHAACYALIAYQTAWLRQNHPCEYMAALISSVMSTKDRVPFYVNACNELGIEVLPPDVNESMTDFAVVDGKIRFGLNAVKGVGEGACRSIIAAREEEGPFESIWDFAERVDPSVSNKRVLEALVKCGALPGSRKAALEVLEDAVRLGQQYQMDCQRGQGSIFDLAPIDEIPRKHPALSTDEFDKNELLRLEKEVLGLYVSEHPLSGIREQLRRKSDATIGELDRRRDGEVVTVGGIVAALRHMTTKRGDAMVFLRLEDVTGGVETVVFNTTYERARELCTTDRILIVKGRIDRKEGETKLVAMEIAAFEAVRREARGVAEDRRDEGRRGHDPRARAADQGLPGRVTGLRRPDHLAGKEGLRLRAAVQGEARGGLLRRGEDAPRRVCRRLADDLRSKAAALDRLHQAVGRALAGRKRRADPPVHGVRDTEVSRARRGLALAGAEAKRDDVRRPRSRRRLFHPNVVVRDSDSAARTQPHGCEREQGRGDRSGYRQPACQNRSPDGPPHTQIVCGRRPVSTKRKAGFLRRLLSGA